jgi:hypothetical protein
MHKNIKKFYTKRFFVMINCQRYNLLRLYQTNFLLEVDNKEIWYTYPSLNYTTFTRKLG